MIEQLLKLFYSYRRKRKFKSFYGKYIKKGDLCFDIGANIGNRTEVFSKLGAKIISVEPVEETFSILKEKFKNVENVTPLQFGLGSKSGQERIHISTISEVNTLSERFIEKHEKQDQLTINWHTTELVAIKTLDQLISEYGVPDFCKIDVEGYELEVLKGLSQPLPLISLEYNVRLKNIAIDCIDQLSQFESLLYNFSPYESMTFSLSSWENGIDFLKYIKALPEKIQTGDIYVKHVEKLSHKN